MQDQIANIVDKLRAGQARAAVKPARVLARKNPGHPDIAKLYGIALHDSGQSAEAASQLARALRLAPDDEDIKRYLVAALLALGKPAKACAALEKWLAASPGSAELHHLHAGCLLQLSRPEDAIAAADKALSQQPSHVPARALRGLAQFEQHRFAAALEDFRTAFRAEPANPQHLLNIGAAQNELHRHDDALSSFRKATELAPGNIEAHQNLAAMLARAGQLAEARAEYRAILDQAPDTVAALLGLAEIEDGAAADVIAGLEAAARLHRREAATVALIRNALGRLHLQAGATEPALAAFERANALRARAAPYDPPAAEAQLAAIAAQFPENAPAPPAQKTPDKRPVIVMGLPRSGTTLVERMLAAHPAVQGLGELGAIENAMAAILGGATLTPAQIALAYGRDVPDLPETISAFVDKMPGNYMYMGYLRLAFPHAVFINIDRDPREVAFSMWQVHLQGDMTRYTSRMDWIAHAANLYRRYMALWHSRFPGDILTISYRDLVTDPVGSSQKLALACGLDWVADMAAPDKTKGAVSTASIKQVREPVHDRSLGKWRAHPALMAPLVSALDPALWPELAQEQGRPPL